MIMNNFDSYLLSKLPRTERIFLRLFCDYSMTVEEIADLYGCGEDDVEILVERAKKAYLKWANLYKSPELQNISSLCDATTYVN